jgi:hypothetical protein
MSTPTRISQIVAHERSISRSLPAFGLGLVLATAALLAILLGG